MTRKTLVTGAAGFIGFHTVLRLLECGREVIGIDNMNSYYDVKLKEDRLNILLEKPNFIFSRISLENYGEISEIFEKEMFDEVIHLAAQVGVRSPPNDFHNYISSNLIAFSNILDLCRVHKIKHLVYASSSSVYGPKATPPFRVGDAAEEPQSLYAATKRANELMAHSYSYQYQIPTTGLRFFTVYGPWGRPDMAIYSFTKKIDSNQKIELYGEGELVRDFTFIDDIIEAMIKITDRPASSFIKNSQQTSIKAPSQIFNIGRGRPVSINRLVNLIETSLGRKAIIEFKPRPIEDMQITHADIKDLEDLIGPLDCTDIEEGIKRFIIWYKSYNNQSGVFIE